MTPNSVAWSASSSGNANLLDGKVVEDMEDHALIMP
jgi:hypothetical protein